MDVRRNPKERLVQGSLMYICKTENIVFILRRLISVDGNLEIVKARVPLGGDILLADIQGRKGTFTPISVIHHMGEVFNDTTRGHYQADI